MIFETLTLFFSQNRIFFFFNVVVKRFAWGYKKQNKSFLLMRLLSSRPPLSLCFLFVFLLPRPSSHMIKRENSASMYRLASDSEKWACSLRLLVAFLALSMLLLYATEDAHLVMPTLPTSICAQQRELASKIKTESKTCYLTVTNYL